MLIGRLQVEISNRLPNDLYTQGSRRPHMITLYKKAAANINRI